MLNLTQSGSFHEKYNAATAGNAGNAYPENTIFPIYFYPIFEQSLQGRNGNYQISWRETFEQEYIFAIKFNLLSLSAFYELPSKGLAGFPDIDVDDSDAQKAIKLLENYGKYQKVGLKLWIKQEPVWRNTASYAQNTVWMPTGETVLQNKGMQIKLNLLPYLGATTFDMINGAIGFSIIDKGNGVLAGNDYLIIVGEWEYSLTAFPRVTGVINLIHALPQVE